jgi:hypothetical protein
MYAQIYQRSHLSLSNQWWWHHSTCLGYVNFVPFLPYFCRMHWNTTSQSLEITLMALINNSLVSYLDKLTSNFPYSPVPLILIKYLEQSLERAEELNDLAWSLHAKVLQSHGVCERLNKAELTRCRIAWVVHAFEDLLLHTQSKDMDPFI